MDTQHKRFLDFTNNISFMTFALGAPGISFRKAELP
jgi:hypothetical protein